MLNLLHVYTSPNHGSSVLWYTDPLTDVAHSHLLTHLTHDPLTHCLLWATVSHVEFAVCNGRPPITTHEV